LRQLLLGLFQPLTRWVGHKESGGDTSMSLKGTGKALRVRYGVNTGLLTVFVGNPEYPMRDCGRWLI
jgi:hypothetical protein